VTIHQGFTSARLLLFLCLLVPVLIDTVVIPSVPPLRSLDALYSGGSTFPKSLLPFSRQGVGSAPRMKGDFGPQITNVRILDFDGDSIQDIIACDAQENAVFLYRQAPLGTWTEHLIANNLQVPAHATVLDIDLDGDNDVVVSILGDIMPNDERIGSIVLLENDQGQFRRHTLLDGVRRVADVQGADFDSDGDIDLAVAVFGYSHGQVLWLENNGQGKFRSHELASAAGAIHVPLADYDGDGDIDIATVISQDDEEVWGYENLGDGTFRPRLLYFTFNFDLGSAGLVSADLDNDGDMDFVLPVGDNFENDYTYPQPYHGCLILENQGDWVFQSRKIVQFGGTYAAEVGDLDGDGDLDIVLVSMFNEWSDSSHASIIWLENDGKAQFKPWQIDNSPTHLVSVDCGDLNNDGNDDIVTGGLHVIAPYDRMGRITRWISLQEAQP